MEKENPVHIKKMEIFHLDKILQIEKENFNPPWNSENFEYDILINKYAYYITLFKDNKIIGYAGSWNLIDTCHITTIAIEKKHQSKGYSKILLNHLIDYSKSKNCIKASLEVNENNTVAIKLYTGYGFKITGRRKKYYNNKDDAIIMELNYE